MRSFIEGAFLAYFLVIFTVVIMVLVWVRMKKRSRDQNLNYYPQTEKSTAGTNSGELIAPVCKKCGKTLEKNMHFCPSCGEKRETEEKPETVEKSEAAEKPEMIAKPKTTVIDAKPNTVFRKSFTGSMAVRDANAWLNENQNIGILTCALQKENVQFAYRMVATEYKYQITCFNRYSILVGKDTEEIIEEWKQENPDKVYVQHSAREIRIGTLPMLLLTSLNEGQRISLTLLYKTRKQEDASV